jgi:hypothetical protein
MPDSSDAGIDRVVQELEHLWIRLGMIMAMQSLINAGVDVTRALEKLGGEPPRDNEEYQRRHSVVMERVRSQYQQEEQETKRAIDAAKKMLSERVREANE